MLILAMDLEHVRTLWPNDLNLQSSLFEKLATGGLLERLPSLNTATGNHPLATIRLFRPLA
jgi:hypothetical protein